MKIIIQIDSLEYELTQKILNTLWNTTENIFYNKYSDISKKIFLDIWDNFNINYDNYKNNLIERNKYLFIKKWNNLIVEDDRNFTSFEIYKNLWYSVYNVKIWMNCNLWCKYCYLLNTTKFTPELTIYGNIKEETIKFLENNKDRKILLNLWEYTDTYLFDKITNLSDFFNDLTFKYPNLIIESRTKLINIPINFQPNSNFILWFSISINEMDNFWKKEQIMKKLEYIKNLTHLWYYVSLKFDPITTLDWYDDDFFNIIQKMDLSRIHHFSIWCLRFSKGLWKIIWKCSDVKTINGDFEILNWKYVNKFREHIYNFFITKMKNIWITKYYLSMDPK